MSYAVWITGPPGSGKSTLAARVTETLRAQGVPVRRLELPPLQQHLLGDRPADKHEQDLLHRALVYSAKLLTDVGVVVIVDATAGRREWREAARALIPDFAEIQLTCPPEICLERERAVRWGLTFEAPAAHPAVAIPDIVLDYEESVRPDLVIPTDRYDVKTATERVLAIVQRFTRSFAGGSAMTPEADRVKRVLVVDDEMDFLATYERLLRRQGYEVVVATSRAAGLAAVGREHPHLIISDIRLPDGSGLDVIRAAREESNPPVVIVVTGYPSDETRRAALAAGATAFLAKPFVATALLDAIRAGLRSRDGESRLHT